ncbi:hypothetical protein CVT24_011532, partial [Panaeolus cyanescens]
SDIDEATKASTATFVTALVFNAAVFAIQLGIFTLLRPYFKAIYEPRTYAPPPKKRASPLSSSMFAWPLRVFNADYRSIIASNGLDAYFFVRFLRFMTLTLLPIWLVSWAVLLPITAVKSTVAGNSGLDRFTFGNVAPDKQKRYAAHLILVYFFTFWIFHNIKKEMRHFVITRQQHLIEKTHAKSVQANTILITGVPARYLSQNSLFKLFDGLPGGVKKVWINRDLKELPDVYDRRLAATAKLESAEAALLRTAAKLRLKALKEKGVSAKDAKSPDLEADLQTAEFEVPEQQRPKHKLGFLGLTGEQVDTINWAREEISVCTKLLEEGRAKIHEYDEPPQDEENEALGRERSSGDVDLDDLEESAIDEHGNPRLKVSKSPTLDPTKLGKHAMAAVGDVKKGVTGGIAKGTDAVKQRVTRSGASGQYPPLNSAFITFRKQIAAHLAVQVLTHHEPYRMSNRYIEVSPSDVIWANLGLNPYEQKIRMAISYAATAGLIILWAFPVAFVGAISNIATVCSTASWLAWICRLPNVVVGIISGILPPVLLAVLMMLLPIVLRLFARFEGIPKYTGLELSLMTRFFIFQVIHSFLIVTLSSGLLASLEPLLNNPTSIPNILAQNLPKASTFFLTYIILQGLTGVAGGFLQIVRLILYYVKLFILGSSPRSVHSIKYVMPSVAWGTLFPSITLLVVITLGYSIISPIINGLACFTFFLFYQLYKYLFLYVYDQPSTQDTGGLFYPKAIQHVFVGLYIQQICLCALFFIARDQNNEPSSIPQGALMVVLIVITAGFHAIINNSYGPLLEALPLSLQNRTYSIDEAAHPTSSSSPTHAVADAKPSAVIVAPSSHSDSSKGKNVLVMEDDGNAPPPTNPSTDEDKNAELESFGFAHPAISRPQRIVWIPRDSLGLGDKEINQCNEAGVRVSDANSTMDLDGKVDVSGSPPDFL